MNFLKKCKATLSNAMINFLIFYIWAAPHAVWNMIKCFKLVGHGVTLFGFIANVRGAIGRMRFVPRALAQAPPEPSPFNRCRAYRAVRAGVAKS